jgi:hypothetical protein
MSNQFKVDVQDYLSIKHNTFKEKMLQLALTNPSEFYEIREKVMESTINAAIGDLYETLYRVMTTGKKSDGTSAAAPAAKASLFVPNVPKQEVGDFCLRAATTMEGIVRRCVDEILPPNIIEVAKSRIASKTSTSNITTSI